MTAPWISDHDYWASPVGQREQIREFHASTPKCGMGGCGKEDCFDCPARTCSCVGGTDICRAIDSGT